MVLGSTLSAEKLKSIRIGMTLRLESLFLLVRARCFVRLASHCFVSVLAGGPADSSKSLQKGDRILTVNSNNIEYATHQEAALILRNSGDTVELLVQHEVDSPILKLENNVFLKPENFAKFEERMHDLRQQMLSASIGGGLQTSSKKEMTVRALFDYTALRDSGLPSKGLSFRFGDIIHVTNASDKEWWQAK